ncbi:MAG TPA: HlyD family secretion protein [Arachidicoccus soli]|uniref:HlyD family secretion protein n=1 Tax=Arachidicoccus soli TaxID=2341117 RepID=A0A386HRQ0_9BACT|nr:HlyD family secretion protein [Arachidicoccus soli]AYD48111.1 HlyD family secretion protein [Arachidicoccus soli]HEU0228875.1 HlyD family secretion protein [Arachidicoccus soli]
MSNTETSPKPKKKPNAMFAIVFSILVIAGIIYGVITYLHAQKHEETDDAQITSDISPVIPHVSGYIDEVRVKDHQRVHKGDTLVILDDRDFKIKLEDAEAGLVSAQSGVGVANAGIGVAESNIISSRTSVQTVDAQIAAAKVKLWRATNDFERYNNLIKDHSITQQQFEQAQASKELAERQLDILETQKNAAQKQAAAVASQKGVSSSQVSVADAQIKQAQTAIDAAKLNLTYTVITATVDGQVGEVNLQAGQFVQAGQALFEIIPSNERWVIANFKETQLKKIKIGQTVGISVDAHPDLKLTGRVSSISQATGAKMSLLPPDNASGNFIKVVQRIPVKINFVDVSDSVLSLLSSGMSVEADVHLDSDISSK